jgi:hypothetical protein
VCVTLLMQMHLIPRTLQLSSSSLSSSSSPSRLSLSLLSVPSLSVPYHRRRQHCARCSVRSMRGTLIPLDSAKIGTTFPVFPSAPAPAPDRNLRRRRRRRRRRLSRLAAYCEGRPKRVLPLLPNLLCLAAGINLTTSLSFIVSVNRVRAADPPGEAERQNLSQSLQAKTCDAPYHTIFPPPPSWLKSSILIKRPHPGP